ncbi:alkaline phosphatase family protein [Parachitinimonas caeni]|uniref:Alkaline phosphatase family protein n=1 Tax=Parachitinimonas caeni TaxID=3031301 RepID=A0ABT7DYH3_9NEIS|nr:alkaline phosphatase family protein [Parachitinimonas caeni]MDK2124195.1 alkaline phosphatase family protein [Parachitinimonas caeni]
MAGMQDIDHVVVLMLENRSFDHMLGFLYGPNDPALAGQTFEGLTGKETNPDKNGQPVQVFRITPDTPNGYFMPGADPGEGYKATNSQLFGNINAPSEPPPPGQSNLGFVNDYAYTLGWESQKPSWTIKDGTTANDIMGIFTPQMLPVLSTLARSYAVCDHWYCSVPTETLPNRAFALAATSQGHLDDNTKTFTCPSIFGLLSKAEVPWAIYGYDAPPLTRHNFPDTTDAPEQCFGLFSDFQQAAQSGQLPAFVFLEPSWSETGNSQHPVGDVALGEQLIFDVYNTLRNSPQWSRTLLVITYDEHGGCYDHVDPPWNATPPDSSVGEFGFDFRRFGPRVPTLLISPLIKPNTIYRTRSDTPLDHTSVLKSIERRWNLASLTARDAAAPDFWDVLNSHAVRTDNPLAHVTPPNSNGVHPNPTKPSHLQQVHADLVARLPVPRAHEYHRDRGALETSEDYDDYIRERTRAWQNTRHLRR